MAEQIFAEEEEEVKILTKDLMTKRGIHYRKQQVWVAQRFDFLVKKGRDGKVLVIDVYCVVSL